MKHQTKLLALCTVVLPMFLVSLPLFAGGQGEGTAKVGTLRVAHQMSDTTRLPGSVVDQILKEYQAAHPEIDLQVEAEPGDALRDKIKIDLAANNLPDVFYYWGLSSLKMMIDHGLLLDVSEYINESNAVDWDDWAPDGWAEHTFDGKQYWAIPAQMFKDSYLVNTDLFDKYALSYPESYDQFISVCGKFADGGIIPMAVGSKGENPSHFFFAEVWYQFGGQEYMKKVTTGEASYVCPETIKAAEIILDMAKNRVFPKDPIGSGDFGPPVALYNEGKAAMIVCQTWMAQSFEEDVVSKSEIINMPNMPGSQVDPKSFTAGGYNNTWAGKAEKYKDPKTHDAFVALLDALTSDAFYAGLAASGWSIPAKKIPIKKEAVVPIYPTFRRSRLGYLPPPVSLS